jgi:predicted nucleic acid-binding protein
VIVLDASIIANVVGDDGSNGEAARRVLIAEPDASVPDLADVETVAVLRRRWLAGDLSDRRFSAALDDLARLPFRRYPSLAFMRRAYQLRANVTAYDAAYVALAEALRCELVTADVRLSRAPGIRCPILVLTLA